MEKEVLVFSPGNQRQDKWEQHKAVTGELEC